MVHENSLGLDGDPARRERHDADDGADDASGRDQHEQTDLGGGEESPVVLAAGLDVQQRRGREQGRTLFSPRELAILAVSVVGGVLGVVAIAAGWISI